MEEEGESYSQDQDQDERALELGNEKHECMGSFLGYVKMGPGVKEPLLCDCRCQPLRRGLKALKQLRNGETPKRQGPSFH